MKLFKTGLNGQPTGKPMTIREAVAAKTDADPECRGVAEIAAEHARNTADLLGRLIEKLNEQQPYVLSDDEVLGLLGGDFVLAKSTPRRISSVSD